jgi:hypothetical protein
MPHSSFETLSDDDLHAAVRRLTARSNVTLAELLAHLGEVETRGIHRSRACASLYTYCLYELRMSEDAAFRRSKAARLVHEHPELRGVIARGELHLTGLLMIAPYLGGERHTEVLERVRFRSKREIARLISEIDPKPEVPPRIEPIAPATSRPATARTFAEALAGPVRSLAIGDRPEDWIAPEQDLADAGCTQDGVSSTAEQEPAAAEDSHPRPPGALAETDLAEAERGLEEARLARHAAHPGRAFHYEIQFTASQEFIDLLDEAFDLLGYRKKAAHLPDVQLRALRELVERLRKRKTGTREATRNGATQAPAPARVADTALGAAPERVVDATSRPSRYIPVAVRRAVWARDASRCAYVDPRGARRRRHAGSRCITATRTLSVGRRR